MEIVLLVPELPLLPSPVLAPPALLRLLARQLQNGFRSPRRSHTGAELERLAVCGTWWPGEHPEVSRWPHERKTKRAEATAGPGMMLCFKGILARPGSGLDLVRPMSVTSAKVVNTHFYTHFIARYSIRGVRTARLR